MKTFFILADTHGNKTEINALKEIMAESDYIIHLGDYARDINDIFRQYPDKVYVVSGNCDAGGGELFLEAEGVKIIMTHGHEYSVKNGLTKLKLRAMETNCQVALYGHTHEAKIEEVEGITFINPGTMQRYATEKTYCYMIVHAGKVTAKIVKLYNK